MLKILQNLPLLSMLCGTACTVISDQPSDSQAQEEVEIISISQEDLQLLHLKTDEAFKSQKNFFQNHSKEAVKTYKQGDICYIVEKKRIRGFMTRSITATLPNGYKMRKSQRHLTIRYSTSFEVYDPAGNLISSELKKSNKVNAAQVAAIVVSSALGTALLCRLIGTFTGPSKSKTDPVASSLFERLSELSQRTYRLEDRVEGINRSIEDIIIRGGGDPGAGSYAILDANGNVVFNKKVFLEMVQECGEELLLNHVKTLREAHRWEIDTYQEGDINSDGKPATVGALRKTPDGKGYVYKEVNNVPRKIKGLGNVYAEEAARMMRIGEFWMIGDKAIIAAIDRMVKANPDAMKTVQESIGSLGGMAGFVISLAGDLAEKAEKIPIKPHRSLSAIIEGLRETDAGADTAASASASDPSRCSHQGGDSFRGKSGVATSPNEEERAGAEVLPAADAPCPYGHQDAAVAQQGGGAASSSAASAERGGEQSAAAALQGALKSRGGGGGASPTST